MPEAIDQQQQQQTPAPADWRTHLTDDLKADPVVSAWAEKASEKDVPSLVKGYAHLSKRLGSAINLPGKDAKPEEVSALKQKLYEAGVFEAPPADPKEYGILKPEKLPEGMAWNDELAGKFASTLHKHGASKALAGELSQLYMEALTGTQTAFKTSMEEGMAALRKEHGEQYDARAEAVKRMIPGIFKTPEELELFNSLGLGDHPGVMGVLLRLAPLAMQDSSFLKDLPRQGGEMKGEDVKAEVAKIMSDKNHPDHAGYWRGDKTVIAKIDEMYRKAYGNAPVAIGGQIISGGS